MSKNILVVPLLMLITTLLVSASSLNANTRLSWKQNTDMDPNDVNSKYVVCRSTAPHTCNEQTSVIKYPCTEVLIGEELVCDTSLDDSMITNGIHYIHAYAENSVDRSEDSIMLMQKYEYGQIVQIPITTLEVDGRIQVYYETPGHIFFYQIDIVKDGVVVETIDTTLSPALSEVLPGGTYTARVYAIDPITGVRIQQNNSYLASTLEVPLGPPPVAPTLDMYKIDWRFSFSTHPDPVIRLAEGALVDIFVGFDPAQIPEGISHFEFKLYDHSSKRTASLLPSEDEGYSDDNMSVDLIYRVNPNLMLNVSSKQYPMLFYTITAVGIDAQRSEPMLGYIFFCDFSADSDGIHTNDVCNATDYYVGIRNNLNKSYVRFDFSEYSGDLWNVLPLPILGRYDLNGSSIVDTPDTMYYTQKVDGIYINNMYGTIGTGR